MTIEQFVYKYSTQGRIGFTPQIEITCSYPFEFRCYETWKPAFSVRFLEGNLAGKVFEWFENLDEVDKKIQNSKQSIPCEYNKEIF